MYTIDTNLSRYGATIFPFATKFPTDVKFDIFIHISIFWAMKFPSLRNFVTFINIVIPYAKFTFFNKICENMA
jgi:hypothetical protein